MSSTITANGLALRNSCVHRGGPAATGTLEGDILTCPWHGFQYDVTTGCCLADPSARLDMYEVDVRDGQLYLEIPDLSSLLGGAVAQAAPATAAAKEQRVQGERAHARIDKKGAGGRRRRRGLQRRRPPLRDPK